MTEPGPGARVHGTPGQSVRSEGIRAYGAAAAARGSFIEQVTARALSIGLPGDRTALGCTCSTTSVASATSPGTASGP